jgi:hypothetical protein
MRISKDFFLEEFVKSETANRSGLDNTPDIDAIANIHQLVLTILQPLRDASQRPIVVTSGFRSKELNEKIGGAKNSQHMHGQAADIYMLGVGTSLLVKLIRDLKLPYDQLIDEFSECESDLCGWVHVSCSETPRGQILRAVKIGNETKYLPWEGK